jgi:hypothetical protein
MKKTIVLASLCVMFASASFAQDKKAVQTTPAQTAAPADMKNAAEMTFEVEEYNFGTIKQGESVTREFSFTNTGKEPLIIASAQGTCGCTVPQYPKEPIAPKAKNSIKVTFNSAGKMGMQDKTVTITSNAKNSPKVLHLKGTVEAPAPATEPVKDAPKN